MPPPPVQLPPHQPSPSRSYPCTSHATDGRLLSYAAPPTFSRPPPLAVLNLPFLRLAHARTSSPSHSSSATGPDGGSGEFCRDGCLVTGLMWAAAYTVPCTPLCCSGFSAVYNSTRYVRGGRGGALILLSSTRARHPPAARPR